MEVLRSVNAALRYILKFRFNIKHAIQAIWFRRSTNRIIRRMFTNLRYRRISAIHIIHKKNIKLQASHKLRSIQCSAIC